MKEIKISVITVVHNGEAYIEQAIRSVINQTYKNIEYIIIDGKSSDSTIKIIEKYQDQIAFWKSEPDESMYEAINKGLSIVSGDYIGILNSDDYYQNEFVIAKIVNILKKNPYEAIYGNRIDVDSNGNFIKRKKTFQVTLKQLLLSRHLTFIGHPTFFMSKNLLKNVGFYNIDYKYASDIDYIIRCMNIYTANYVNIDIVCFRLHQNSITASGKINLEREIILNKLGINNYSKIEQKIYYYLVWFKYLVFNWKNLPLYLKKI